MIGAHDRQLTGRLTRRPAKDKEYLESETTTHTVSFESPTEVTLHFTRVLQKDPAYRDDVVTIVWENIRECPVISFDGYTGNKDGENDIYRLERGLALPGVRIHQLRYLKVCGSVSLESLGEELKFYGISLIQHRKMVSPGTISVNLCME